MANTAFHDPLILSLGQEFLGLSTDLGTPGVQARLSRDLLDWSAPFPLLGGAPPSVVRHTGVRHFWAPELVKRGEEWRLYVCASRFGTTQSVIGLATATEAKGPYRYQGDVLQTVQAPRFTQANAIDPCVCPDRAGKDYLIYGSFFGGIHILPLTEEGFPAAYDEGTCIAGGGHQAVEGAYCCYHAPSDQFVLFTSWGSLRSDYHIRVGYSREITGPYRDANGLPLTDQDPVHTPGDKLCGGYHFGLPGLPGVMATGHNSLMRLGDAWYLVHHARPEGDERHPFLQIRRLLWDEAGHALAWPLTYTGEPLTEAPCLPDRWRMVYLSRENHGVVYAVAMTAAEMQAQAAGTSLSLRAFGKEWQGFLFRQGEQTACTLRSVDGESLWGIAPSTK